MSQRANAGFNAPGFSVAARDDGEVVPASNACSLNCPTRCPGLLLPLWSDAWGDPQPANFAADCKSIPPDPRRSLLACDSGPRSLQFGVGQPATFATICKSVNEIPMLRPVLATDSRLRRKKSSGSPFAGFATGVGHPANTAASTSVVPAWCLLSGLCRVAVALAVFFASPTTGVGHPEQSLSDVRRADARSAQIGCPDFIAQCFQVNTYSGEPFTSIAARNLLSNDDCRPALGDESQEVGP
jgi:hypothetical protein